jgi:hypothetical protein
MIISIEQRVRIFILSKDEASLFPDEKMVSLAREDFKSGAYLPRIIQRAEEILTEYTASADGHKVQQEERPLAVRKAELLIDHVRELKEKAALMNHRPSAVERAEADRERGPIGRDTLNL